MNFVKHIAMMAMVAFAAIAFTACENDDLNGANNNLVLSVDVDNITATSAKIKVTHNGKTADSWYGYLTTNIGASDAELVNEAVANLKRGDIASSLIFNKNYTEILTPLSPKTTYKYIAFGLTEEGVVYGERASVKFTTLSSNGGGDEVVDEVYDQMLPNPAWKIAYTGAGTINDEEYKHTVTVNSTDNNPYNIAVIYAREYDSSNPSQLRVLGEQLVASMNDYLNSYNSAYGTSYVLNDMLYRGSGVTAFDDLDPGYYIAVAIGITAKGEVSGLYAVSQTFHIEEETPTALYQAWLGDWVIKGDNNISNNVVIGRKIANKSINLIGLMGLPFSVEGEYSIERNDVIFSAQVVASDYTFNDGSVGDIHLIGSDQDGKYYGLDNGNYGIAIAGVIENGAYAIVRYGVNLPDYPKFNAMFLTAYVGGKYYNLGNDIPSFNGIAELAPAESTTSGAAPMLLSYGKRPIFEQSRPLCLGKELKMVRF